MHGPSIDRSKPRIEGHLITKLPAHCEITVKRDPQNADLRTRHSEERFVLSWNVSISQADGFDVQEQCGTGILGIETFLVPITASVRNSIAPTQLYLTDPVELAGV